MKKSFSDRFHQNLDTGARRDIKKALQEQKQYNGEIHNSIEAETPLGLLKSFETVILRCLQINDLKGAMCFHHLGSMSVVFKNEANGVVTDSIQRAACGNNDLIKIIQNRIKISRDLLKNGFGIINLSKESGKEEQGNEVFNALVGKYPNQLSLRLLKETLGKNSGITYLLKDNCNKIFFLNIYFSKNEVGVTKWILTFGELTQEQNIVRKRFEEVNEFLSESGVNMIQELENRVAKISQTKKEVSNIR